MAAGRIVWGVVMVLISGATGDIFTWQIFMTSAVLNAVPGIILQLILIPSVMLALGKTGLVHFYRKKPSHIKES